MDITTLGCACIAWTIKYIFHVEMPWIFCCGTYFFRMHLSTITGHTRVLDGIYRVYPNWFRSSSRMYVSGSTTIFVSNIAGLMQERHNCSVLVMELRLSCTKPSICSINVSSIRKYFSHIRNLGDENDRHWQLLLSVLQYQFSKTSVK